MRRVEYVQDFYDVTWTEEDYIELLKYLRNHQNVQNITRYEVLKDISFQDVCDILLDRKEDIRWELIYGQQENQWSCVEYLSEYIRDMVREDCFNMGCNDSECYDSEESLEVLE